MKKLYVVLCFLVASAGAQATIKTWDAGGDGVTWEEAANWDNNVVPGSSDTVRFLNINADILLSSNPIIGRLELNSTSTNSTLTFLSNSNQILTINGDFYIRGQFTPPVTNRTSKLILGVDYGGGEFDYTLITLAVNGNINYDAPNNTVAEISMGGHSNINLKGNLNLVNATKRGRLTSSSNSIVTFNGTGDQTFAIGSGVTGKCAITYSNITIDNTSGIVSVSNTSADSMNGNSLTKKFLIKSSSKFSNNGITVTSGSLVTLEMEVGAKYICTGTTAMPTGGTSGFGVVTISPTAVIEYNSSSNQTVERIRNSLNEVITHPGIEFTGTGTKTLPDTLLLRGNITSNTGAVINYNSGIISMIGTGTQTINGVLSFNNFSIDKASGGVVVGSTAADTAKIVGFLTINSGTLTTNNKLILLSTASATASLIDNASAAGSGGSLTGNVVVQRYTPPSEVRAHYFGMPVAGTLAELWGTSTYRMFFYDETKGSAATTLGLWTNIFSKTTTAELGRGYGKYNTGETNSVTGVVNNGTVNYPITYTTTHSTEWGMDSSGYNLVGNPYPSAINWDATSGWTKTNIDATIYMWNGTQYATWNGSSGTNGATNGVIGSMQAFFVKANGAGSLSSTNSVRVTSAGSNTNFYRTAGPAKISLNVTANNYSDEAAVVISDEADMNFESDKDGFKLAGIAEAPMLATKSADNKTLSINTIPNPTTETEVPVVFRAGFNGQHRFHVTGTEHIGTDGKMYLIDSKESIVHDLMNEPEYLFTGNKSDESDRFKIVFRSSGTTDLVASIKSSILVHAFNESLFVKFQHPNASIANVVVYDITGRSIYANSNVETGNDLHVNFSGAKAGIYIVNVSAGSSVVRKKVVLK